MWSPDGEDATIATRVGWSASGAAPTAPSTKQGWTELHIKELQANTEALTFQTSSTLQKIGILNSSRPIAVTSASGLQKVATVPGGTRTINFSGNGAFGFPPLTAFTTTYSTAGSQTFTIPRNADYLDIILLGAGGGGGGHTFGSANGGTGGGAGSWATVTLQRGVQIPWSATTLTVLIGAAGTGSSGANGSAGGSTSLILSGTTLLTANGGTAGTVNGAFNPTAGGSPGNTTYNGTTYTGGTGGATQGGAATAPGAGGGGGNSGVFVGNNAGGAGSPGRAWVVARQ